MLCTAKEAAKYLGIEEYLFLKRYKENEMMQKFCSQKAIKKRKFFIYEDLMFYANYKKIKANLEYQVWEKITEQKVLISKGEKLKKFYARIGFYLTKKEDAKFGKNFYETGFENIKISLWEILINLKETEFFDFTTSHYWKNMKLLFKNNNKNIYDFIPLEKDSEKNNNKI